MAEEDFFAAIRESCRRVADAATHVSIRSERIAEFADNLDLDRPPVDPGQEPIGDAETTAAFVLTLDAINFGSGYFPWLRKRAGHSGYHTVAAGLRDWVAESGPITTERLAEGTVNSWAAIFGQELDGSPAEELIELFTLALADLAAFVDDRGGRFLGVVEEAAGSAATLASSLTDMPFYRDRHDHPSGSVHLYKRAQITVQDLAVAFGHDGPGRFVDLADLTMFADNLVPHVLRVEGALDFSPELLGRIERVDNITVGSTEEVEIRACGLHAVELLHTHVAQRRPGITVGALDNLLWNRGADPGYKSIPRHRSRCVFY